MDTIAPSDAANARQSTELALCGCMIYYPHVRDLPVERGVRVEHFKDRRLGALYSLLVTLGEDTSISMTISHAVLHGMDQLVIACGREFLKYESGRMQAGADEMAMVAAEACRLACKLRARATNEMAGRFRRSSFRQGRLQPFFGGMGHAAGRI